MLVKVTSCLGGTVVFPVLTDASADDMGLEPSVEFLPVLLEFIVKLEAMIYLEKSKLPKVSK
jgi:hypothetical protein